MPKTITYTLKVPAAEDSFFGNAADGSNARYLVSALITMLVDIGLKGEQGEQGIQGEEGSMPLQTQGAITANGTPQALTYDQNTVSGSNGIVYLPTTTLIGKEVIVNANANITVQSNVSSDLKIYTTNPNASPLGSVKLLNKQAARFIYRDSGFWQMESVNQPTKNYIVKLTNNGGGSFTSTVFTNDFYTDMTFANPANGRISFTAVAGTPFTDGKTFLKPVQFSLGGGFYFGQVDTAFTTTSALHIDLIEADGTQSSTPSFADILFCIEVYP